MAVSSLKGCWSKLSARIRDYIDVVDSYYRPADELDHIGGRHRHHHHLHTNTTTISSTKATSDHKSPKSTSHQTSHKDRARIVSGSNSKPATQNYDRHRHNHHHHQHDTNCSSYQRTIRQLTLLEGRQHQPQSSSSVTTPTTTHRSASALGFTKRKTAQGQVYFVDQNGHKYWHDPSVPKELLNATLDLDLLVGPLSSNWETSRTITGKVYFINHTKKSTQFTDPRLITYKETLMSYLRHNVPNSELSTNANDLNGTPSGGDRLTRTRLPLTPSNNNSISHRDSSRTTTSELQQQLPGAQRRHSTLTQNSQLNNSALNISSTRHNQSLNANYRDLCHDNNLIGGTLSGRANGRHNLLMGSVQNLSTNSRGAGNSNTLTGPPPRWLAEYSELVAPTLSHLRKQAAKNNRSSNNHSARDTPTNTATETVTTLPTLSHNTHSTSTNLNNNNNTSLLDNCLSPISTCIASLDSYKTNTDANKELYDKISILRQELLKQQVLSHPCKIDISRKRIFEESFRAVSQMQPRELKKRLLIKFRGEEGLDYGGVAREWFYLLSREILNPVHGLFQYTSDDNYNLQINPDSGIVYREHMSYMNFCGRIMGMAVFHGHFMEGRFTLPFYKMLLRKRITLSDIEFVDHDLHRSLCWILNNDITDVIDTTFSVQHNAFGELQEHELKPGGRNIQITEENKHEYVTLYVNYRCRRGIENQFAALQRGFYELIQPNLVENFDEHELELLIGGLSKINFDDWRLHTKLKNCTVETPLVRWFWDIVKSYDEDRKARLLQFVTGSPRVPIQGFKALQGVNSELRLFTIHLIRNGNTDNLPKSHTCFNRIDLPPYETYDKLRDKLTQAIEETMGFAMQ